MCAQRGTWGSWPFPSDALGRQFKVYHHRSLAAKLLKKHSGALFPAEPSALCQAFLCGKGRVLIYIFLFFVTNFISVASRFPGMLSASRPTCAAQNLLSAQDELSSCVFVRGVVNLLPAVRVTQVCSVRDSAKGRGSQEERKLFLP